VEASTHAAGERRQRFVRSLLQSELVEEFGRDGLRRATGQSLQTGDEPEVLTTGELLIDRGVLSGDPDELPDPMRVASDVHAEDLRLSPADRQQGREHVDRRRLPRAVRSQESEDLPGADVEIDAVNSGEVEIGRASCRERVEAPEGDA